MKYFLTLALLSCGLVSAQSRLTFSGTYAPVGTTATVALSMVGGGMNPAAFQCTVPLPTGAVITPGPGLTAAAQTLSYNVTPTGQATLIVSSDTSSTATVPDGIIASISFPSAPFQFAATNPIAVDSQSNVVGFTVGTFSAGPSCDLTGDGKVDTADLKSATDQITGKSACVSADVTNDGKCTVEDRQRILIAATGGTCRIGR